MSTASTLDRNETARHPLTAQDRCDVCGARAYVRASFADGELLFCAHHAHEYMGSLKKVATSIQDETDVLRKEERQAIM